MIQKIAKAYILRIFWLLIFSIPAFSVFSQVHFWTSTSIEGSPLSVKPFYFKAPLPVRPVFDQSLYWRSNNRPNNYEKTFYNFHSVYLRDSMIGLRVYGVDFDLLHEAFKKKNTNKFRYWNNLRMGFSFLLEKNYKHPMFSKDESFEYINAEVFISFMHIPHKSRGDQSTKARVGTWMLFVLGTPSRKFDIYLKIRPFAFSWLKFYYTQEYDIKNIGICAEFELNRMGYDKSKVHSSKEIYQGFTLTGGPEINIDYNQILLRFGVKYNFRNH